MLAFTGQEIYEENDGNLRGFQFRPRPKVSITPEEEKKFIKEYKQKIGKDHAEEEKVLKKNQKKD